MQDVDKEKLSDKAGTLPGIALNWPQCGNKGSRTSIWHILQRCKLPKLMQEPHLLPRHMQAHLRFAEDRKYIKHQLEHGGGSVVLETFTSKDTQHLSFGKQNVTNETGVFGDSSKETMN
ncbi:unnamed protein product [Ceratitis capitata]|uniref:(Mediterranean fruit fly) hypothetical protein n=1 Tax=Ceratitis capitata TaxID=7213 RepID=A0A811UE51_CERCA|nr:unnamed protein product [Ceratitis capitata]